MKIELNITESYWPAHKEAIELVLDGACDLLAENAYRDAYPRYRAENDQLRLAINAVCRAYGMPDRFAVQEGKG